MNQFVTTAVAEKLSALMTEDRLGGRAIRGDRGKFERALTRVKAVAPIEGDELKAAD